MPRTSIIAPLRIRVRELQNQLEAASQRTRRARALGDDSAARTLWRIEEGIEEELNAAALALEHAPRLTRVTDEERRAYASSAERYRGEAPTGTLTYWADAYGERFYIEAVARQDRYDPRWQIFTPWCTHFESGRAHSWYVNTLDEARAFLAMHPRVTPCAITWGCL